MRDSNRCTDRFGGVISAALEDRGLLIHVQVSSRHGGMVITADWKERAADQTPTRLRLTNTISDASTHVISLLQ
jgi:hypothetical protein